MKTITSNKSILSIAFTGLCACGNYSDEVINTGKISVATSALDGTAVKVTNEFEGQQITASDIFSGGVALLERVVTGKASNITFDGAPCNDFELVPLNGGPTVIDTITFYDGENEKKYWVDYGPGCNGIDQCDEDADCGGGKGFKCIKDRCVPDCTMDSDCHDGNTCNLSTHKCVPNPDDDSGGQTDGDDGTTGATETDGDSADGSTTDPTEDPTDGDSFGKPCDLHEQGFIYNMGTNLLVFNMRDLAGKYTDNPENCQPLTDEDWMKVIKTFDLTQGESGDLEWTPDDDNFDALVTCNPSSINQEDEGDTYDTAKAEATLIYPGENSQKFYFVGYDKYVP